ncbi:hypothetical protein BDV23DRAFT_153983 [Aspergillus alliaceus]|uniref:Uncharacterized protein n=1 Tax=Petromyces alliaceus TaxID=209559 RepID=A0A5N7CA83_PETAA|nr:hypothetical protein BDV23DRAFT_153983 [Aspergillus alliaceus]
MGGVGLQTGPGIGSPARKILTFSGLRAILVSTYTNHLFSIDLPSFAIGGALYCTILWLFSTVCPAAWILGCVDGKFIPIRVLGSLWMDQDF